MAGKTAFFCFLGEEKTAEEKQFFLCVPEGNNNNAEVD